MLTRNRELRKGDIRWIDRHKDRQTDRQTEDKRRLDYRDKERHKKGSYHIVNDI